MISLKKKMLLTRGLRPFLRGGSFETGLEGWELNRMVRSNRNDASFRPQTGSWAINCSETTGNTQDYFSAATMIYKLTRAEAGRLRISARVSLSPAGRPARARLRLLGNGGTTVLAQGQYERTSSGFAGLAIGVVNGDNDLWFEVSSNGETVSIDDWSIEARRP